jgi:hypothetical protein
MEHLHFALPEHASMSITTTPAKDGEPVMKDVLIEGLSLDDLVFLRDVIQDRIDGYRFRINRTILGG